MSSRRPLKTMVVAVLTFLVAACAGSGVKSEAPEEKAEEAIDLPEIMSIRDTTVGPLYNTIRLINTQSDPVAVDPYYDTVVAECASLAQFADWAGSPTRKPRCSALTARAKATPARIPKGLDAELAALLKDPIAGPAVRRFIDGVAPDTPMRKFTAALFAFDRADLRRLDRQTIRDALRGYGIGDVSRTLVVGYTDSTGPAAYNQVLSERRAANVASYLKEIGVEQGRMFVAGVGERPPVATNRTAEGRTKNRRARIFVYLITEKSAQ